MLERFDKKYLKDKGEKIILAVLALAIGAYIAYQAWHYYAVNVECERAMAYTVTEKSSGEGCIIRKEVPIPSEEAGSLVASVDIGTRVGVGDEVARTYSASSIDVERRLDEIDKQLALLSATVSSQSVTGRDVTKLDSEVYSTVTEMSRCIANGNFSDALAFKSSLVSNVNKRSVASGLTVDFASQISALQSEKSSLTSQLGSLRSTVCAPVSGWYYPECDGFERIFTFDQIKTLTYESFRALSSAEAQKIPNAGKIVTDCNWYFVCEMSEESLGTKELGEEYTLYFPYNRNEKLTMTLTKICEGSEDFGAAVFTTDKIPSGFDFQRMQSYELLENEYTGFRVPKSAVRIIDGQMGVFVLSGEVVHFRRIDVMTEHENSYIVKMSHEEEKENEESADKSAESDTAKETAAESTESPETEGETQEEVFDPASSPWLKANENIIVQGKGMREGRIITNME